MVVLVLRLVSLLRKSTSDTAEMMCQIVGLARMAVHIFFTFQVSPIINKHHAHRSVPNGQGNWKCSCSRATDSKKMRLENSTEMVWVELFAAKRTTCSGQENVIHYPLHRTGVQSITRKYTTCTEDIVPVEISKIHYPHYRTCSINYAGNCARICTGSLQ